jgi:hypothetical protein
VALKGLRIGLIGACLGFAEPQRHTWKGSSKMFRMFEGPQVYQLTLLVFSLLNSSIKPLEVVWDKVESATRLKS